MLFYKNTTVGFIPFLFLIAIVSADYFAGLPIDQKLLDNANLALDRLKQKLEEKFDCNEDNKSNTATITKQFSRQAKKGGFNILSQSHNHNNGRNFDRTHVDENQPRVLPFFETHLKKNNDRSVFQFRFPSIKTIIGSTMTYVERVELQRRLKEVSNALAEIKAKLVLYNNAVVGENNKIKGSHNVVIGSRNNLKGNNYWVFDSDVHANASDDGVLIIQNYLIELTDIPDVILRPYEVIRCINQGDSNRWFRLWWDTATPYTKICF